MKLCHSLVTLSVSPPYRSLSRHPKSLSSELPSHRVNVAESLHSETLKILEWPSVCTQLAAFTSTSMGLAAAQTARIPLGKCPDDSRRLLAQTSAAVDISQPLDFSGIEDVSAIVDTSVAGEMLSTRELCSVQRTLRAIRALLEQLEDISAQNDLSKRYYFINFFYLFMQHHLEIKSYLYLFLSLTIHALIGLGIPIQELDKSKFIRVVFNMHTNMKIY